MGLFTVPDQAKDLVIEDPLDHFLSLLWVTFNDRIIDNLVQIFDALDTLLKELRLKALLDERKLEDLHFLSGLLAGHQAFFNHVGRQDCLVCAAIFDITNFDIF